MTSALGSRPPFSPNQAQGQECRLSPGSGPLLRDGLLGALVLGVVGLSVALVDLQGSHATEMAALRAGQLTQRQGPESTGLERRSLQQEEGEQQQQQCYSESDATVHVYTAGTLGLSTQH